MIRLLLFAGCLLPAFAWQQPPLTPQQKLEERNYDYHVEHEIQIMPMTMPPKETPMPRKHVATLVELKKENERLAEELSAWKTSRKPTYEELQASAKESYDKALAFQADAKRFQADAQRLQTELNGAIEARNDFEKQMNLLYEELQKLKKDHEDKSRFGDEK